jgi:hypothetical protein
MVRALSYVSRGKAGESGAFADHIVQRAGGNELGLGNATHFDERAKKVFNAFLLYECLEIVCQLCASVLDLAFNRRSLHCATLRSRGKPGQAG